MKNDKGITLLSLVATVVILALLTLVTINIALHRDTITKVKNTENEITSKLEDGENKTNSAKRDYNEMNDILSSWDKENENSTDGNTTGGNTTGGNTTGDNTTGGETTCAHTSTTATDNGDGTHTITCTNCGVKLITNEKHKYVNGKCTVCQSALVIGAKINYHEYIDTDGNAFSTMPSYTSTKMTRGSTNLSDSDAIYSVSNNSGIEWVVLGQEGNQIKITTKNIVQPTRGGYTSGNFKCLYFRGKTGYANFVNELNKIGALYGHGRYADTTKFTTSGGRSFKMEDLGYGALTRTARYKYALETHSGDTEAKVYRYGVREKPDGTSTTGGSKSTFEYMELDASNLTQETEASHTWNELTTGNSVVTIYDYIYGGSQTLDASVRKADANYWLASRVLWYDDDYIDDCAYLIAQNGDRYWEYVDGNGSRNLFCGIRPVVYLQTGIKLSYDATNGYTISQ